MGFLPADRFNTACDQTLNAITATATSFAVTSGQGTKFPNSNFFVELGINANKPEIVHISARASDTLTMDQRGLTGPSGPASAWPANTPVQVVFPANIDDMFAHVTYLSDCVSYLMQGPQSNAGTTVTAVIASGQIIPTLGLGLSRCTVAANASAAVMVAGVRDGQIVTVENQDATHTITFAASGTSNVADGTSDVIAALTARSYEWNATKALWYRLG
jgi:hypothetical protein